MVILCRSTAPASAKSDDDESGIAAEPVETWGIIAAVLGNRRNLAAFQQAFWWDDERSFRLYLKAAKGHDVSREVQDPDTGLTERRQPAIVAAEQPPLPTTARAAWRDTRDRLLTIKQEVEAELQALEAVRRLCRDLTLIRRDIGADGAALKRRTGRPWPIIDPSRWCWPVGAMHLPAGEGHG